jgi:hypothetical protein
LLDLHIATIELFPLVANLGLDLPVRLRKLAGSDNLCRMASMRAALLNNFTTAVELLEEGKTVFWQQALQPYALAWKDLPSQDKNRLSGLMRTLEHEEDSSGNTQDRAAVERRMERRRTLNLEIEEHVAQIRTRKRFERFFKIADYVGLSQAAKNGPIVILIDASRVHFALIITSPNDTEPIFLFLPSVAADELRQLRRELSGSDEPREQRAEEYSANSCQEAGARPIGISRAKYPNIRNRSLAKIWFAIVKPIFEHLRLNVRLSTMTSEPSTFLTCR